MFDPAIFDSAVFDVGEVVQAPNRRRRRLRIKAIDYGLTLPKNS